MRFGIWYLMNIKRLLKRISFIVLLLLIPVLILAMRFVSADGSGVLRIVLCCEDKDDEYAAEIADKLTDSSGIILYSTADSPEAAEKAVAQHQADAAWILHADLEQAVSDYNAGKGPMVTVIEREDNPPLRLSRTLLYGKLFPQLSYDMYERFVVKTLGLNISHKRLQKIYNNNKEHKGIVEIKPFYGGYAEENENLNYLNSPLRGLLSLVVMLCGLAAAMYYLDDKKEQRYSSLQPAKHIFPALALCLAAVTIAGLVMLAAIFISGTGMAVWTELLSMLLFIPCAAGFALFMCTLFRSPGGLGAALPFFIIFMLVLCPVFLELPVLEPIKLMLPPTMYLRACVNPLYLLYLGIYIVCIYGAAFIVNGIKKRY